ncbi:MAG: Ig-like domain-containing protein [Bacteroidetes bacterium]|nr:Ig-like domain-containing protein [Bacteroidota bacterium]
MSFMKYSRIYLFFLIFTVCSLLWECANPVAPEGGPKDTQPPKALKFTPPNHTTNYTDHSIKIDFNEFIALKNQAAEVTVSPPLKTIPDLRIRGKSLVIKLDDTLSANTTYSIDFGKAISDITENNALLGFSYVFSTGPYIDSLSLQGKVFNSFDLSPQKDLFALLYLNIYDTIAFDSLPLKVKPYYVTKTNEKGEYMFHNLKASEMKLTALADLNGNLIFDQASEKVAFNDSLVKPYYIPIPRRDSSTAVKDSLKTGKDTIKIKSPGESTKAQKSKTASDTIKKDTLLKPGFPSHLLFLFDDIDSIQRIQKSQVIKKGLVLITFSFPTKSIDLKPLNCDTTAPWALKEFSKHKDSLYLWILNTHMDSLILRVCQDNKVLDTLKLELIPKDDKSASRKKEQGKVYLGVNNNTYSSNLNQFTGNFTLIFSYPLASADFKRIKLIQDKDTLKPKAHFADSLKRLISIETKWKEDKSYVVFIPDSVFIGINGLANDTIRISFKTHQAREFGNLILDLDISKHPGDYIIQLLGDRDALIGEKRINSSGKVKFEFLTPGKFKVKAVFDRNHNGRWDTGNFRKKIQPEEVFYLQKTLEIRANWDVEEKWNPVSVF